ncbi:hypothetical protein [Nocardioides sp.]|nr:hypothetical protein [Nocardioides sp.]
MSTLRDDRRSTWAQVAVQAAAFVALLWVGGGVAAHVERRRRCAGQGSLG